jgi:hypothetical protein
VEKPKKQQLYNLTPKMSFRTGSLEHDVIVFCPVTGIVGKLEMPWLPVNLSYTHPLAKAGNALLLVRKYLQEKRKASTALDHLVVTREALRAMFLELDRQVLAGCILSLLQEKKLLRLEAETSMVERNLVLQNAGSDTLCRLLLAIEQFWENPQVWKRMPALNIEYSQFGNISQSQTLSEYKGAEGIAITLQSYTKILRDILNPHELTQDERAKIFEAQKKAQVFSGRRVKIYSASAVQHRRIKESKTEAYEILDTLKPHLSIVLRTRISKTLRELLILPLASKQRVANDLSLSKVPEVLKPMKDQLIHIILSSSTDRILEEIGTLSQEISPLPTRSIAEILATKQAKGEDKREHNAEREIINNEVSFFVEGRDSEEGEEADDEQE